MDSFLAFLVNQNAITSGQAERCQTLATAQKRTIPPILVQQGYFTKETLTPWMTRFQQQKNTVRPSSQILSPLKGANPLSVVSPILEELEHYTESNKTATVGMTLLQISEDEPQTTSPSEQTILSEESEAFSAPISSHKYQESTECLEPLAPEEFFPPANQTESNISQEKSEILEELASHTKSRRTVASELTMMNSDIALVQKELAATTFIATQTSAPHLDHSNSSKTAALSDRYTVVKTLGEGGMGLVQLVRDRLLGREVALKTIKLAGVVGTSMTKRQKIMLWRLNREAEITAHLGHPNIIQLYDLQKQDNGELYFTMPKIEGGTFSEILRRKKQGKGNYDEEYLLSIFLKVCDAIAYAHTKGVIHRDLKPDNIMVGAFGEVYVMDWGIAKELHQGEEGETALREALKQEVTNQQQTIGGMGTPGYMPPEQAENASQVTPQADIYALGMILKQCFTLMSPLEELRSIAKTTQKINIQQRGKKTTKNTPSPNEHIPSDVHAIILKATQELWKNRYPKIQELAEDLKRYQRNMGVSVREYTSFELMKKWFQRNRQKIILGNIFLILCISFLLYLQWDKQKQQKQKQQELQKKFLQAKENADKEIQNATQIQAEGRQEQADKISYFLNALNFLNSALQIHPEDPQTEKQKLELGKNILELCFQTKDYQLANYLAREINTLEIKENLTHPTDFIALVNEKRDQTLKEHQERFQFWKTKLQGELEPGDRENALSDIARMQEKEIFDELLIILKSAKNYFISKNSKDLDPRDIGYYSDMTKALGCLENQKATKPLLTTLQEMADSALQEQKKGHHPSAKLEYMVTLVQALADTEAKNISPDIKKIREQMKGASGNVFTRRSKPFFHRLEEIDGIKKNLKEQHQKEPVHNNPETYSRRASELIEVKDYVGAIKELDRAIQLQPKFEYYLTRAEAKYAKEPKDAKGAEEDCNEAIRLQPKSSHAYSVRGLAKYTGKDIPGAIEDFTQAIQLNPKEPGNYNNRGKMYLESNHLQEALKDYEHYVQLDPKNALAFADLAQIQLRLNLHEKSLDSISKAIELEPNLDYAFHHRGGIRMSMGLLEKAIEDYGEVIRLNPKFYYAYIKRGEAKLRTKDYQGAVLDYTEAVKQVPFYPDPYRGRADAKWALNDIEGALADYTKAVDVGNHPRFNNSRGYAFMRRAELYNSLKKYDEAIMDYDQALLFYADLFQIYYTRGLIKHQLKRKEEARQDFKTFLDILKKNTALKNDPQMKKAQQNILQWYPELR